MSSTDAAVRDPRAAQAHAWAEARLGLSGTGFSSASADASFRRYFRLAHGARTWIVMDAPPEREDSRPFVRVARMLARWGVHAPRVEAEDLQQGFLLLSDLGRQTFLDVLTDANADDLLGAARDTLLRMQTAAAADPEASALPPYDAALLWRETRLFPEWYLERHLGVKLSGEDANELERMMGLLVKSALSQPRIFVHRDYMPRNLMVSQPDPGVLDFQDAVHGPISYDVICLYKDAFRSWPAERVRGWIAQYWERARQAGLPVGATLDEFWRDAEWMGLQRHFKVLGIFARLCHRDAKPKYVADTPRFVRYVMDVAPRYPELKPLVSIFERHVLPKLPA